jgi:hypothetical protein
MNAMAKRNPPLPSFHESVNVLGYAISVYRIGAIRIKVVTMLEFIPNRK